VLKSSKMTKRRKWTNPSVLEFAQGRDPVDAVIDRARDVVMAAIDEGWAGPPFDPLLLADLRKVGLSANPDVPDARTIPVGRDGLRIEFNPTRPRGRLRYSVAHEIAHTLFPDCGERIRNRSSHENAEVDEWQLEALCNIAAAEFLMPVGSFPTLPADEIRIERLMQLRQKFDVSAEAVLIRSIQVADEPCAMFCASRREDPGSRRYRVDYALGSRNWDSPLPTGELLAEGSLVSHCDRIGHTAIGDEAWTESSKFHIEAVGIPPYPGSHYPRVVGILTVGKARRAPGGITYLRGSATEPHVAGPKMIVHLVNDATANWGGSGFALALMRDWPDASQDFRNWAQQHRGVLRLGNTRISELSSDTALASLIAQRGYGPSAKPRIRYGALQECLSTLASETSARGASLHMPRIGCGQAGGSWDIVREMIATTLCAAGLQVFVYDPPGADTTKSVFSKQTSIAFHPAN
jgi:hypothetical protein